MPSKATRPRNQTRFTAELFEGHKGVLAIYIPFDPEVVFKAKAIQVAPRVKGWLVRGRMNGTPFDGWIGLRYGRFFMVVDPVLKRAAKARLGSTVEVILEPTVRAEAAKTAGAQAEQIRHRR